MRGLTRTSRSRSGSVLVEALLSILMLAIILVALMAAFTSSLQTMAEVDRKESAILMAYGILDELESVRFSDLEGYIDKLETSMDLRGTYGMEIDLTFHPTTAPVSAEVLVTLDYKDGETPTTVMRRELSDNAYRSVGVY